jgi:hypothetical protein
MLPDGSTVLALQLLTDAVQQGFAGSARRPQPMVSSRTSTLSRLSCGSSVSCWREAAALPQTGGVTSAAHPDTGLALLAPIFMPMFLYYPVAIFHPSKLEGSL